MKITTLKRLRDNNACVRGYDLIAAHVGIDYDGDIPLITILEVNGLDDCIWALQATDGGKEIAQEFAIRVAKKVYFDEKWTKWADGWLDGSDRSKTSAAYAANAANAAYAAYAAAATYAANAAYADAATYAAAADAAAAAADARNQMQIDNIDLLRRLINGD